MTSLFEQTEQPAERADLRPHAFESLMRHHSAQSRRIRFLTVGYRHVSDTKCASSGSTVELSMGIMGSSLAVVAVAFACALHQIITRGRTWLGANFSMTGSSSSVASCCDGAQVMLRCERDQLELWAEQTAQRGGDEGQGEYQLLAYHETRQWVVLQVASPRPA